MDYIISEDEIAKYRSKFNDLENSNKELQYKLLEANKQINEYQKLVDKYETTIKIERATTSTILQKLNELNIRLMNYTNSFNPARVTFSELV